jgi:lysophospholipase L1-like esterase
MKKLLRAWFVFFLLFLSLSAHAELPWEFDDHTRYMALGDSLTAGYGAVPATQGYVYQLYRTGVFDTVPNTLLSNAGVPGATSRHVLDHQVPQAIEAFRPTVITITVGGNDLLRILNGEDPNVVLNEFQTNLSQILLALTSALPDTRIYINNLYTIPEIPGSDAIVPVFNNVLEAIAGGFGIQVADVYSAFLDRIGLLLINRNGAGQFEVHPTNAGYREIAHAFEEVVE